MCQSCGMPLKKDEDFGTEKDGTKCVKYCSKCYQKGAFTEPTITAKEMQKKSVEIMRSQMHIPTPVAKFLAKNIPKLERWQTAPSKK